MKPLISIIIPTFNSIGTLSATLDSLAAQTLTDFEVLAIDGASTDATVALLEQHAAQDTRLQVWSAPDQGIYDAMNKGIVRARGEWLYFLGSDDCLHDPAVLADVAQVLRHTAADLVYGDAILLRDGQRYGGPYDVLKLHTQQNLCHQVIFYRRSVFERLGNYNLKYWMLADWDLNIRCFRHPQIETHYLRRDIVRFNNITGISSQAYDDPLLHEIALVPLRELNSLKKNRVLNSKLYGLAKSAYQLVKSIRP